MTEDSARTREPATAEAPARTWSAYIGGRWSPEASAPQFAVHEPATGQLLALVEASTDAAVARAVADSRRAYDAGWRHTTPRDRAGLLREAAAVIRAHAGELAELTAREVGKPLRDALRVDIVSSHSAASTTTPASPRRSTARSSTQGRSRRGSITSPTAWSLRSCRSTGRRSTSRRSALPRSLPDNTVVIKPGEQAPLTVLRLVEIANEVLPPGVVNAVAGPAAGPALTRNHPLVERITFTGATATGRKVLRAAAKNLTYTTLELGGKNALHRARRRRHGAGYALAIEGMFYNQGEACTSTARLLVHPSRYDEFATQFAAAAGRARSSATPGPRHRHRAPWSTSQQQQRVLEHTCAAAWTRVPALALPGADAGQFEAARAASSSRRPFSADVTPDMTVAQDEIFGPARLRHALRRR